MKGYLGKIENRVKEEYDDRQENMREGKAGNGKGGNGALK